MAVEDFWTEIRNRRGDYLRLALADSAKWLAPASVRVGSRPSDQYWLEQFKPTLARTVSEKTARSFLVTFQLVRFKWNIARVVHAIELVRSSREFDPIFGVSALAAELREANERRARQTSAASKLANFLKPRSKVFIWDQLATRSARARDHFRATAKGRLRTGPYKAAGGDHDYAAFWQACRAAHYEERQKIDFQAAVDELRTTLRKSDGLLDDPDMVSDDFFERRLLDKLMFWEGWALHRRRHPDALCAPRSGIAPLAKLSRPTPPVPDNRVS